MEKTIYKELIEPLPKEAIQKSEGSKTGKGYDTTGYGYQFIVNRLNDILGVEGWSYKYRVIDRMDGVSSKGTPRISVCVEMDLTIGETTKSMVGGHTSNNYIDALKGAITNSLKKSAAMFGIGKEAYEKTIDEDNLPPDTNKKAEEKLPAFEVKKIKAESTIQKTVAGIRSSTDKVALQNARKGIEESKNYSQAQKNVLLSAIDIRLVELK
jgi:hypothetical protein